MLSGSVGLIRQKKFYQNPLQRRTDHSRWYSFQGNRVIAPAVLRSHMVRKVHSSHIGIDDCLRKAGDFLFWPEMSAEIKDSIAKCDKCNTYQTNEKKEPLISHGPPKRPWSHFATALFVFDMKEWFIIVDHLSDYFELSRLPDTQASTVIKSVKNQFARHGIRIHL